MALLTIAGFTIPVVLGGSGGSEEAGGGGFGVTGRPLAGALSVTESVSATTPILRLAHATAIDRLCSSKPGHVWRLEDDEGATSIWSSAGLGLLSTDANFTPAFTKFGAWSILQAFGSIGDVSVANVGSHYTVAAWVNPGGTGWQHEVLRSDGAQWVDGVRDDGATLHITVAGGVFQLLEPGSGSDYFGELVWLRFKIWDDWGAQWPQDREFSNLPDLEVAGDRFDGYQLDGCRVACRVTDGMQRGQLGAVCQLDIRGPERTEAP